MSEDAIAKFKEAQRQGWKHFAPLEALTTPAAARLVKFANVLCPAPAIFLCRSSEDSVRVRWLRRMVRSDQLHGVLTSQN